MAAPPVGTGDASTQQLLDQAYADSRQQFQSEGIPSNLTQPYQGPGIQRGSVTLAPGQPPEQPPLEDSDQMPEGAVDPFAAYVTPPKGAVPVKDDGSHGTGSFLSWRNMVDFLRDNITGDEHSRDAPTHGNGDAASISNFGDFLTDATKGFHPVDAIMSGLASTGGTAAVLAGGTAAKVADKVADIVTGRTAHSQAEDAVFDWKKKYIDSAVEDWEPKGDNGEAPGGAAEFLNNAAKMAPNLVTGGAGFGTMIVKAGMDTATDAVDQGKSTKEAMTLGAVDALTTAAFAIVSKFGNGATFAKRVVKQIPAGAVAQFVGDFAKKAVLTANGHKDEADKIDLLSSQLQAAITNIGFALVPHGGKDKQTTAAGVPDPTAPSIGESTPVPAAAPPVAGDTNPATPPVVASQGATEPAKPQVSSAGLPTAQGKPGMGTAADQMATHGQKIQLVPDKPSPEPQKDYAAQWKDMNAALTPRVGVLIPKGATNTGMEKGIEQARSQGRVLEFDQGTLVLKNKGEMLKAQNALKAGADPQAVIGKATGAGFGKTPEQTAVVQGHTKDGAVASESMVTPAEVPAKVAQMNAEGKTPVVTTPEAAVQRRQDEIAGQMPEGAEPVAKAEPAPVADKTEKPDTEAEASDDEPKQQRAIVKTPLGDKAVLIEGEAKDGKVPVRLLDSDGEPTDQIVHVPQEHVSAGGEIKETTPAKAGDQSKPAQADEPASGVPSSESTPAKESTPQKTDVLTQALSGDLAKAKAAFVESSKPPKGRKNPGSVQERAGRVSEFARALSTAVKGMTGKANPTDLQAAMKFAKKAERLDQKSDEAISKGQGIGHTELSVHEHNLTNAAERLLNPDHEWEPKESKQVKLKAKVAKEKATEAPKPAEKPEAEAPKEKTAIKDVPDERPVPKEKRTVTKGDELRLKGAGERLMRAEDGDLDAHMHEIDKMISDIYGDSFSKDDRKEFMTSLLEMRAERKGVNTPKGRAARDAEIEREMSDYRDGEGHDDDEAQEGRILAAHEVNPEMAELHARLERSKAYAALREASRHGEQYNLQKFLAHMAGNTPAGALRDFMHKLAAHTPATDALRPVGTVINHGTGQPTGGDGLYEQRHNLVQVKMAGPADSRLTHKIIHEATHAATVRFSNADPTHPFIRETKRLHQIFEKRLRARLGDAVVQAHLDYHRGTGPRPVDMINNLYGLKDHKEFMAEATSNSTFQQLIVESEHFVQKNEGFIGGEHTLADSIVGAIKRALGIFKPKEAKLLKAVLRNVEDVMEAQKLMLEGREAEHDIAALNELRLEPQELRGVGEPIRRLTTQKAGDTARDFTRAIQKGAPRALRRVVLANETHDQIVRSNSHWFGRDDETNPLRKWNAVKEEAAAIQNRALAKSADVVKTRQRLDRAEDKSLGELQRDATQFGIDPSLPKDQQAAGVQKSKGFDKRYDEYQNRWNKLSDKAKSVFTGERDANKWMLTQMRKAGVDLALEAHEGNVSDAQRSLLYSIKNKAEYAEHIGAGKAIDLGEHNEKLTHALEDLAAVGHQGAGPYFPLGRNGDYVVQVSPEGTKEFGSKDEAEAFAQKVRDFGPTSKAKVAERGGKWVVDHKSNYVSMHETAHQAEREAESLRAQGHEVDNVSNKLEAAESGSLTKGMESVIGEVTRKLGRNGGGEEVKAMTDALRTSFVQMMAQRSAYASSKLARRGFGGVKGEEMGRNFAAHTASNAWHLANMKTTMASGEALGRVRELSKRDPNASQRVMYKRGAVMRELSKRTAQEVSQQGIKNPASAISSKLGFANFLASPGHMIVNLTQNFTTAMPVAGAKWGFGRSTAAFARAHNAVFGNTAKAAFKALKPGAFTAEDMFHDVIKNIEKHPTLGKWARGENSALHQLMDRGIISNSFATELGNIGKQGINSGIQRAYDYGRILPQIAEVYNRITTALVGLEMTKGDLTKTADFVRESHVDYSQANKTRMGKVLTKVPFGNTVTMFRTYVQGMRHLLYSNVKNMVYAETKSRGEAAKTVAGLILAQTLFAGAVKGAALEPLRGIHYLWNQLFGDADQYSNLDNSMRHFISDAVGNKTAADAISGGLPHLLGFDLSGRMGLSDLFLHDPPDLLHTDTVHRMAFLGQQLGGPMGEMVAQQIQDVMNAYDKGDAFKMMMALVPVKLFRDSADAYQLLTKGHQSSKGAQLTPPSAMDAAYRAMGLKPADVARVQEKQGTAIEYKDFADNRKQRLLKAWASGDAEQKRGVRAEILKYNHANPGQAIKPKDLINQGRGKLMAEREAKGGKGRDPVTNKLLDY